MKSEGTKALIVFWRSQLDDNHWSMSKTTRQMIAETLRVLRKVDRDQ